MKKQILTLAFVLGAFFTAQADVNLQLFYDFGSQNTACGNQRTNRVTSTVEMFHPDNWGSTYFFIDIDYSINKTKSVAQDPRNTPFGTYWEISRALNFWKESAAKDLSLHVEYDGGLGIFGNEIVLGGYGINHAALFGFEYFMHTADFKNTFTAQLLFKYIVDNYNRWNIYSAGKWNKQDGNLAPLQFTFVWTCNDFCTAPGLTFSGFFDIWGQKQSVYDRKNDCYTDPTKQSFVFLSEPQLWYCVGQHFKCPNLNIGAEVELSYNFTGKSFMCNPCVGLKWVFL